MKEKVKVNSNLISETIIRLQKVNMRKVRK